MRTCVARRRGGARCAPGGLLSVVACTTGHTPECRLTCAPTPHAGALHQRSGLYGRFVYRGRPLPRTRCAACRDGHDRCFGCCFVPRLVWGSAPRVCGALEDGTAPGRGGATLPLLAVAHVAPPCSRRSSQACHLAAPSSRRPPLMAWCGPAAVPPAPAWTPTSVGMSVVVL